MPSAASQSSDLSSDRMEVIAVVVPCYNESERLEPQTFVAWLEEHPRYRFVFVNDGSIDRTEELLLDLQAAHPGRIYAYSLPENGGKAEAVRQGVLHACEALAPDYFAYWDADLATPLQELPGFAATLDTQPHVDIVLGSRVKLLGRRIERRPLRHYLGRIFATAASMTLRLAVYDTQCGAKMFRNTDATRAAFHDPFTTKWVFDVQLLKRYLHRASAGSIVELPLHEWRDVAGSKVKPQDFFVAFFDLLRIARQRRPRILPPGEKSE